MLKNNDIQPRLATRYLIKAGGKSDKGYPQKWDHFKVCSTERNELGNPIPETLWMEENLGTDKPTEVPFMFFSNDPRQCYDDGYSYRTKSQRLCYSHDGLTAFWSKKKQEGQKTVANKLFEGAKRYEQLDTDEVHGIECPGNACPMQKSGKCKINLRLVGFIPKPDEGFVFQGADVFYSSSYNSAAQLRASMETLIALTGGKIAFEPLILRLQPKKAIVGNQQQTVYIVSFFPTRSVQEIQSNALPAGERPAEGLIGIPAAVDYGEDDDISAEFYPEDDESAGEPKPSLKEMWPDEDPPEEAYDVEAEVSEPDEEHGVEDTMTPKDIIAELKRKIRAIGKANDKSDGIINTAMNSVTADKKTMAGKIEGLKELLEAWQKMYGENLGMFDGDN